MEKDSCTATYFTPSLWKQRRAFILDTLKEHKVQKVLDYGCGEGSVLSFLIPPSATDDIHFTHLQGLDIDRQLLEQETLEACQPWPSDYEQLREAPLTVDIYSGSVDQFDDRLMMTGYADAIVCSEVIEHVYPDTLKACLPLMLGIYAPSLVIVTTPNAEYNVFFPDLQYGAPGATFRHDDHKFEWTRQEFEKWCLAGAKEYGYNTSFHGIGLLDGKLDQLDYGHCTQACVFTKQNHHLSDKSASIEQQLDKIRQSSQPHTLLKRFDFPYYDLPPLSEKETFQHIESYLSDLCQAMTLQQLQETRKETHAQQKEDDMNDELDSPTWSTESYDFNSIKLDNGNDHPCTWGTEFTYTDNASDYQPDNDNDNQNINFSDDDDDDEESDSQSSNSSNGNSSSDDNEECSLKDCKPFWTMTPLTIKLDTLWSILHIRQLCTTKQRLIQVLGLDQSYYKVMDDQIVVHKSFRIEDRASFGWI